MNKQSQAGSATSFIIIAIILVALTIGGVAYVVQRGNQVRRDAEAAKIAKEEADKTKTTDTSDDETVASNSGSSNTNTSSTQTPTQPSSELPKTGMELNIIQVIALALLTYGTVAFISSRRPQRSL